MRVKLYRLLALLIGGLSYGVVTYGQPQLRLPSVFGDHMMFQRNIPLPVWGLAKPGERIVIRLNGPPATTLAGPDGRWKLTLPPAAAGRSLTLTVQAGKQQQVFHDVMIGEVWLSAGDYTAFARQRGPRIRTGSGHSVRIFAAKPVNAEAPQFDLAGRWLRPEVDPADSIPALALQFARRLSEQLDIPVGIINVAGDAPLDIVRDGVCKGTPVEAFISGPALEAEPAAGPVLDYFRQGRDLAGALNEYRHALDDWKFRNGRALGAELKALNEREPDVWYDYVTEIRKSNEKLTLPPKKPTAESLARLTNRPAGLYNSLLAPVAGYAIKGVVWSQGTANLARAYQYRSLLSCLIKELRRAWNAPGLPVALLGLPPMASRNIDPRPAAELREAQALQLKLPGVALAVTDDLEITLTPLRSDYQAMAARLAAAALGVSDHSGKAAKTPRLLSVRFRAGKVSLIFNQPLRTTDGQPLHGFAIAGEPYRWTYASGVISRNVVTLAHPGVKQPVAVRYNWVTGAAWRGNLSSTKGMLVPVSRSDDWQAYTQTERAVLPDAQAPLNRIDLYPVADPGLPYVLLIGDSIMGGYYESVAESLNGQANVWSLTSGLAPAESARRVSGLWQLQQKGRFAVIHFNDGLHSMPPRETDEQFEQGLRAYIAALQPLGARLIWATITPSPDSNNQLGEQSGNPAVLRRNAISRAVAGVAGIAVDDLYSAVIARREVLQGYANLHFTPEGSQVLGQSVSAAIREALAIPSVKTKP